MIHIIIHYENKIFEYQMPEELTIGQLLILFRKRISLNSKHAIFLINENCLLGCNKRLIDCATNSKLEIICKKENTFG